MNVTILSTGCAHCNTLENRVERALDRADVDANVETIDDMQEVMNYGVMSVPALVVDGEVVSTGDLPTVTEITDLLRSA